MIRETLVWLARVLRPSPGNLKLAVLRTSLVLMVAWFLPTAIWAQELRTWTDSSGQFTVEATLKSAKPDSVTLLMADGTTKNIPLDRLSEADRQYVADYRKAMLAENAAKKKAADEAKKRGADLNDEIKTALDEFAQAENELKQSETDAARFRIARQKLVQESCRKLLALTNPTPQADPALDAYLWIIRNSSSGPEFNSAIQASVEHFADNSKIVPIMNYLVRDLPLMDKLLGKTKNKSVQGMGSFMLAQHLANSQDPANEDRIVKLLNEVVSRHADLVDSAQRPLGPQAKQLLFVIQHLSVGKVAPDIVGVDLDGVPFKLSDYRGKVVLLDFWGDW